MLPPSNCGHADEHRIGLKPVLRRIWVRKGSRPRAVVQTRYQWMYVYGFVHPQSGRTVWLLLPLVNVAVMNLALQHFAESVGASATKQIALVLDQAGWHKSRELLVPEGLHLIFLPPYSPELQRSRATVAFVQRGRRQSPFPVT